MVTNETTSISNISLIQQLDLTKLKEKEFSCFLFIFTTRIIIHLYLPVVLLSPANPARPGLLAMFAPLEMTFVLFPSI